MKSSSARGLWPAGVASFAEAWIEISSLLENLSQTAVASFAEAWIEIQRQQAQQEDALGRLLRGGVD